MNDPITVLQVDRAGNYIPVVRLSTRPQVEIRAFFAWLKKVIV